MRTSWIKHLLGSAGLLAAALLGLPAAQAATTVNLTAQRASLTLPDGTVAAMWSYCGGAAAGAWLTVSPLANTLGFVPLPPLYWLYLAAMLLAYAVLTQLVKTWFIRKFGE